MRDVQLHAAVLGHAKQGTVYTVAVIGMYFECVAHVSMLGRPASSFYHVLHMDAGSVHRFPRTKGKVPAARMSRITRSSEKSRYHSLG